MATKGARAGTAKDRALEYVKAQVLTGAFPGGELISEGDIATALGMSRTPVREAFLRMEAEGLLRLYPQRGALVVPVSPEEVRAVIEARLVLEQYATRKVVGRGPTVSAAVFGRLSAELRRQHDAAAANDWREFLDSDRAFHAITLDESQNAILAGFYSTLRDRQMRMIGESAQREPDRVATIMREHLAIAEALRDGDLPRALQAVQTHLASTVHAIGLAVDVSLI
ncbi:GntR family transcriptional regulator [Mycobacterium florentinum]|uniref:GntR family transcriptional regulator n=1 Tax=Mycobacterium florentinum TaxID=292462 RepID=A0A1X1UIG9_MYCFL|nr:GntR family transcriptional regulator [Mycobacterium florentinum]MCV7409320.1 GntR family transcriptional regulator [Mycobacterium florentinum]ORV56498.1 GntR family transcriptional regulator [Mycobacterium florentinum]BBX78484.1 GntR family transcriptional regulator [Mycobacterium florentinum]